jgi:predicted transcriptional regulator of viral defense system
MANSTLIQSTTGFIRLSMARSAGLGHQVQRQAKAGDLIKIRPGLYRLSHLDGHPHQGLLDVCAAVPSGVICLVSALAFHGLTTTLPKEVWVAIPRNAYAPVMGLPCRFIRMGDGIHQAGVETLQVQRRGTMRIFGKAVSVCQGLHFRERIGLDLALEALRTYLRQGGSIRALEDWADVCRVRKTLTMYLEAILQ